MTTSPTVGKPLRVRHLNALSEGGAYNGAVSLHRALLQQGVDSQMLLHRGKRPKDKAVSYLYLDAGGSRLKGLARKLQFYQGDIDPLLPRRRPGKYYMFKDCFLGQPTPIPDTLLEDADILHLHWIMGMVDFPTFFPSIPAHKPLVWTLHDYAPFTGGCHYPDGCRHYETGCGNCHYRPKPGPNDASRIGFQLKQEAYRGLRNLHIVGDSRFMMEEAQKSPLVAHARSFQAIHYSTDLETYQPFSKAFCRRALNLPLDALIVAYGAIMSTEYRKGGDLLESALAQLAANWRAEDVPLCKISFGMEQPTELREDKGVLHKHFGYQHPGMLAMIYNAADMFVIPSREEAFGQVAMESLACGTPVIGFRTGGIPEIVLHEETGLLAEPGNAQSLAAALERLGRDTPLRERLGARGAKLLAAGYTHERQAREYLAVYERALALSGG